MWQKYNPNPAEARTTDCTIRSICCAEDREWMDVYMELCLWGATEYDMPDSNRVYGKMLKNNGYKRHVIPDTCPACYTVQQFAQDHPEGIFILMTDGHVVTIKQGDWWDTWDSATEIPAYYWEKGNNDV